MHAVSGTPLRLDDPRVSASRVLVGGLSALALVRVCLAATRIGAGAVTGSQFTPVPILLAYLIIPTAAGGWLLVAGRGDPRARPLGVVFLLAASAYANLGLVGSEVAAVQVARRLWPVTFLPYFLWTFVHRFPVRTRFGPALRVDRAFRVASLFLGGSWFLVEAVPVPSGDAGGLGGVAASLKGVGAGAAGSLFWLTLWTLVLPALAYGAWKTRFGGTQDRRRSALLLWGVALGFTPAVLSMIAWGVSPTAREVLSRSHVVPVWTGVAHASALSVPLVVAWAVVSRRALSVGLVIRQAVWYLLARNGAYVLLLAPVGALVVMVAVNRDRTVASLFSGWMGLCVAALVLSGIGAFAWRHTLLRAIDRRFFRERYRAREVLGSLADRIASERPAPRLFDIVESEIERALQPTAVRVFLPDGDGGLSPVGGGFESVHLDGPLGSALAKGGDVVLLDRTRDGTLGPVTGPAPFALMVPVRREDGELDAVLALGERRSEEPYTGEDVDLLQRVAQLLALRMPRGDGGRGEADVPEGGERNGHECTECGGLGPPDRRRCGRCGGSMVPASVPLLLFGKIRVEERIGEGGMGVVYRGVDQWLDRAVAIKTLRGQIAGREGRLRREARSMALVAHPHLATIYGVESWRGSPVLLVEYLEGGTLRDRISRTGPIPPAEAVEMARKLAAAVHALHTAGILHRDIKPSNVGFTREDTPKLLDFGLARFGASGVREFTPRPGVRDGFLDGALTRTGGLVGTLAYLSPEALDGAHPEPAMDVWALLVVLFECLSGQHPFRANTSALTALRIRRGEGPDTALLPPATPPDVAFLLATALSGSGRGRPRTAPQLLARLGEGGR